MIEFQAKIFLCYYYAEDVRDVCVVLKTETAFLDEVLLVPPMSTLCRMLDQLQPRRILLASISDFLANTQIRRMKFYWHIRGLCDQE